MNEYNELEFLDWLNRAGAIYRQSGSGYMTAIKDAVNGRNGTLYINPKTGEAFDQHILSNKYAWKVKYDPDTGEFYLEPANKLYRRQNFNLKNTPHYIENVKKEHIATDIEDIFKEVGKYNTTRGWKKEVGGIWSPEKIATYDNQIKKYFKEHPEKEGSTTTYVDTPPVENTSTYAQNIYDAQGNLVKTSPIDINNYTSEQMKRLNDTLNMKQRRTGVYTQKLGGRIATRYQLGGYLDYIAKYGQGDPIVKRKGWDAKDMQTWSLAKKKEVLNKYGKEGLTDATYKWLYYTIKNEEKNSSQKKVNLPTSQELLAQTKQSIELKPSTTKIEVTRIASTPSLNLETFDPSTASEAEKKQVQTLLKNEGLYKKAIDGIWGSGSSGALQAYRERKLREKQIAAANEYSVSEASWLNDLIDDTLLQSYPFGYTETRAVDEAADWLNKAESKFGITIPGKENLANIYGAVKKFFKGATGKDEAGKLALVLADLDLSDPEQLKQAEVINAKITELEPKWGAGKNNVYRAQEVLRGRIDQTLLHTGKPQRYNSYMINPDFTAKGEKVTYVYVDPKKRQAERDYAKGVIQSGKYTMSKDGKYRIYSADNGPYAQHGANYSIVTDADGSNPRYVDIWDFGHGKLSSNLFGTRVPVGDVVS